MNHLEHLITTRKLTCKHCGTPDALELQLMADGPHYARITCNDCGAFITWAPKPTTRPKNTDGRKANLLNTIRHAWNDEPLYCLICLRDERTLPTNTWLEAHHILEHADGGTDHPTNLQPLCNECHALIHWRRRTTNGEQINKPNTWKEPEHAPS